MRKLSYRESIDNSLDSPTKLLKTKSEYFQTERSHKVLTRKKDLLLEVEKEVLADLIEFKKGRSYLLPSSEYKLLEVNKKE